MRQRLIDPEIAAAYAAMGAERGHLTVPPRGDWAGLRALGQLVWPDWVAEADVQRMFRFEGESDPGDEMVVFGLVDPGTGAKGTLASAFGPAADPETLDHLVYLAAKVDAGPQPA